MSDAFESLVGGINDHVAPDAPPQTEADKRDAVLDGLEVTRADLIAIAKATALELVGEHGTVTSPMVLARMRKRGYGPGLDACDRRWMGAVFRSGTGWRRVGWENGGSHGRPVARWERS